jgi:hypothetical protein
MVYNISIFNNYNVSCNLLWVSPAEQPKRLHATFRKRRKLEINNYSVIYAAYKCDFVLYLLGFGLLFVQIFCTFLMSLCSLCN